MFLNATSFLKRILFTFLPNCVYIMFISILTSTLLPAMQVGVRRCGFTALCAPWRQWPYYSRTYPCQLLITYRPGSCNYLLPLSPHSTHKIHLFNLLFFVFFIYFSFGWSTLPFVYFKLKGDLSKEKFWK